MDKKKVLDKIKKCLALSKSANEHEAAMALKQAQVLMEKYQVTDAEVELSAVSETGVNCAQTLPTWQQLLVSECAKAFGVECLLGGNRLQREVRFIGIGVKPELAAYAYEVLLRQLKKERREYMKSALSWELSRTVKTGRADLFCLGWVKAVADKVSAFASPPQERDVLDRYIAQKGQLAQAKARDVKCGGTAADVRAGIEKGKGAQLHHAMNGAEGVKQIGCES